MRGITWYSRRDGGTSDMVVNWQQLKKSTIALLALIVAGSLTLQVNWINDHITPLLASHPHLAPIIPGILMILSLLHSPQGKAFVQELAESAAPPAKGTVTAGPEASPKP